MLLMGISGPNGAGKSTMAYRLSAACPEVQPLAWGHNLKPNTASHYPHIDPAEFGWKGEGNWKSPPGEWVGQWDGPKTPRGREILKREGDRLRKNDPKQWLWLVEKHLRPTGVHIIHDVRTLIEINWLTRMGGKLFILGVEDDRLTDNSPTETEWRAYAFAHKLPSHTRESLWQELSTLLRSHQYKVEENVSPNTSGT